MVIPSNRDFDIHSIVEFLIKIGGMLTGGFLLESSMACPVQNGYLVILQLYSSGLRDKNKATKLKKAKLDMMRLLTIHFSSGFSFLQLHSCL